MVFRCISVRVTCLLRKFPAESVIMLICLVKIKPNPRSPSIQIIPTMCPKVYRCYLHWAIWILGKVQEVLSRSQATPSVRRMTAAVTRV